MEFVPLSLQSGNLEFINIYYIYVCVYKFKTCNIKLFIACQNSDGLTGFYYSHHGFWASGYTWKGWKTKAECARTCTQSCIAINTYAITWSRYKASCFHYRNRADTVPPKKRISSWTKAYIRCLGRNERGHCSKIAVSYSWIENSHIDYTV